MSDIINSYHPKFSGGIGDFLRGSIYLYQQAKRYGLSIDIDWKYHPVGQFIKSEYQNKYDPKYILDIEELNTKLSNPYGKKQNNWKDNTQDWIDHIFSQIITNKNFRPAIVSSWYSDIIGTQDTINLVQNFKIDKQCKKILKNKIQFSKDIEKLFNKTLPNNNYSIIHFRLGDRHTLPDIDKKIKNYDSKIINSYNLRKMNHDYDYYYYLIKKNIADHNLQNVIIMSDSNHFKKFIFDKSKDRYDIHILHFNSAHTSLQPGLLKFTNFSQDTTRESYRDTVLDLKYIINSKLNITYSCYAWGSGFVVWPSKIYNVPLQIEILTDSKNIVVS